MNEMWAYIAAILCIAVIACLFVLYFSSLHRDSIKRERDRKEREAEIDREMEDWRREQREAFHFDAQKFLDSFLARNGTDAPACPICGGNEYDVFRDMAMIRHQSGMKDTMASVIPCATLMCRNCGRLEFLALGGRYADIDKKTWACDEKEKEQ